MIPYSPGCSTVKRKYAPNPSSSDSSLVVPCDDASFIAWRTRRFRSRTSSSKISFFEAK